MNGADKHWEESESPKGMRWCVVYDDVFSDARCLVQMLYGQITSHDNGSSIPRFMHDWDHLFLNTFWQRWTLSLHRIRCWIFSFTCSLRIKDWWLLIIFHDWVICFYYKNCEWVMTLGGRRGEYLVLDWSSYRHCYVRIWSVWNTVKHGNPQQL